MPRNSSTAQASTITSAMPRPKNTWFTKLERGARKPSGDFLPHTPSPIEGRRKNQAMTVVAAPYATAHTGDGTAQGTAPPERRAVRRGPMVHLRTGGLG